MSNFLQDKHHVNNIGLQADSATLPLTGEPKLKGLAKLRIPVFFSLMKPRVMSLVVFTALTGLFAAPGHVSFMTGLIAITAIAVGAGASGALNMWYDSDIDAIMTRTQTRAIPAGKMAKEDVLSFGLIMSVLSVLILTLATNMLAGALLAFTIFFYAVVYTVWLKRSTPQNIVIGGAAGSFPPMIGWAVVTGNIAWASIVLFAIIFLWTPPHFWALALVKSADYAKAGIPMMPNVRGEDETRRQIVIYSLLMAPVGVLPYFMGFAGQISFLVGALGGAAMLWWSYDLYRKREGEPATKASWRLFAGSIFYLFALFAAILGENLLSSPVKIWQFFY
jgi:heme o synthase